MTEEEKKALRADFARSGGQTTLKRHGKGHFKELGKLSGIKRRELAKKKLNPGNDKV